MYASIASYTNLQAMHVSSLPFFPCPYLAQSVSVVVVAIEGDNNEDDGEDKDDDGDDGKGKDDDEEDEEEVVSSLPTARTALTRRRRSSRRVRWFVMLTRIASAPLMRVVDGAAMPLSCKRTAISSFSLSRSDEDHEEDEKEGEEAEDDDNEALSSSCLLGIIEGINRKTTIWSVVGANRSKSGDRSISFARYSAWAMFVVIAAPSFSVPCSSKWLHTFRERKPRESSMP